MAFSLRRRRRTPRGRYTPNLWPVWIVASIAVIAAGLIGWGIYHQAYGFFADAAARQKPPEAVDVNDVLKATVTVLTLTGAVLAGLYAYRKQLLSEGDAHRADASQLADRYTTAAGQLGHDQAAVRLAGVYALARLADDWEEQRQVCIDVLCAYLRMPYDPNPDGPAHRAGEKEVRLTIISVIHDHLRHPDAPTAWCIYTLDFTGAVFDGGDFSSSHFRGTVRFDDAWFTGSTVIFDYAEFTGSVAFRRAHFTGGTVSFVSAQFVGSTVASTVFFNAAQFAGGRVVFDFARFANGVVSFDHIHLGSSTISFAGARFTGGTVTFDRSVFAGGNVTFESVHVIDGGISFYYPQFQGTVFLWGPIPVPAGA